MDRSESSLWRKMELVLTFTTPLCGGVPRCDDMVRNWAEQRIKGTTDYRFEKLKAEAAENGTALKTAEEVTAESLAAMDPAPDVDADGKAVDEVIKQGWVGFFKDKETGHLYVRGGSLRAHIKDLAQTLGSRMKTAFAKEQGLKEVPNFKAKMTDAIYIQEEKLFILGQDGQPVSEPTDFREATVHAWTPKGPVSALKRVDWVMPATIRATVMMLEGGDVNRDHLDLCLQYGMVHGFNQDRSLQFGRYTYELGE